MRPCNLLTVDEPEERSLILVVRTGDAGVTSGDLRLPAWQEIEPGWGWPQQHRNRDWRGGQLRRGLRVPGDRHRHREQPDMGRSWGTLSIPLRYGFHASGHGCHAQLPPRAMRSSRMKNEPETGGQPYEPFMFARKHGLSIDEARKILDEYGGDRAGSDAAATALSRREAKTAFTLHHLQRSQR
ncbi:MAG: hypothetical protein JWQ65_140 [Devosia sp.]|nr:hypothetical protein [Devosia sp.]